MQEMSESSLSQYITAEDGLKDVLWSLYFLSVWVLKTPFDLVSILLPFQNIQDYL